jgi:hypothetical protein
MIGYPELSCLVVFFNLSGQIPGECLKLDRRRFLPRSF